MVWKSITENFTGYFCGLITALLSAGLAKIRKWRLEQKALKCGLLALLHDRLYRACGFYIKRGFCSIEDKRNLEYMYKPYAKMGGNGICKRLFEQCMNLPSEKSGEAFRTFKEGGENSDAI